MTDIITRMDDVDTRIDKVDTRIDNVDTRIDNVDTIIDNNNIKIIEILTTLSLNIFINMIDYYQNSRSLLQDYFEKLLEKSDEELDEFGIFQINLMFQNEFNIFIPENVNIFLKKEFFTHGYFRFYSIGFFNKIGISVKTLKNNKEMKGGSIALLLGLISILSFSYLSKNFLDNIGSGISKKADNVGNYADKQLNYLADFGANMLFNVFTDSDENYNEYKKNFEHVNIGMLKNETYQENKNNMSLIEYPVKYGNFDDIEYLYGVNAGLYVCGNFSNVEKLVNFKPKDEIDGKSLRDAKNNINKDCKNFERVKQQLDSKKLLHIDSVYNKEGKNKVLGFMNDKANDDNLEFTGDYVVLCENKYNLIQNKYDDKFAPCTRISFTNDVINPIERIANNIDKYQKLQSEIFFKENSVTSYITKNSKTRDMITKNMYSWKTLGFCVSAICVIATWKLFINKYIKSQEDKKIEANAETKRLSNLTNAETERLRNEVNAETERLRNEANAETERLRNLANAETERLRNEANAEIERLRIKADLLRIEEQGKTDRLRIEEEGKANLLRIEEQGKANLLRIEENLENAKTISNVLQKALIPASKNSIRGIMDLFNSKDKNNKNSIKDTMDNKKSIKATIDTINDMDGGFRKKTKRNNKKTKRNNKKTKRNNKKNSRKLN